MTLADAPVQPVRPRPLCAQDALHTARSPSPAKAPADGRAARPRVLGVGAAAAVLCLCAARLPATGALLALAVSLPPVRRALPAVAAAVAAAVLPAARLGVPRACRLLLLLNC